MPSPTPPTLLGVGLAVSTVAAPCPVTVTGLPASKPLAPVRVKVPGPIRTEFAPPPMSTLVSAAVSACWSPSPVAG